MTELPHGEGVVLNKEGRNTKPKIAEEFPISRPAAGNWSTFPRDNRTTAGHAPGSGSVLNRTHAHGNWSALNRTHAHGNWSSAINRTHVHGNLTKIERPLGSGRKVPKHGA